jgi:hypothetical protein
MATNPENSEGYIAAFRQYFPELSSTDPNRFPTGKKKFWVQEKTFLVQQMLVIPMDFGCSTQLVDCMPSFNVIFMEKRSMFGHLNKYR